MNPQLQAYAQFMDWTTGNTKHAQTNRLFFRAASLGVPPEEAMELARNLVVENGGQLRERDIQRQCERAYAHVEGRNPAVIDGTQFERNSAGEYVRRPALSECFLREKLRDCVADFPEAVTPSYLRAKSSSWPSCWRAFLQGLYSSKQVVLMFRRVSSNHPIRLDPPFPATLAGKDGVWFLCNPVTGRATLNSEGKMSFRSQENVTDFKHLVLECDHPGEDVAADWLRFLVLLPMPIRAIYTSGGKSVHALVAINASSKEDWDSKVQPLKRALAECGADPAAMSAVRLTRLPYCLRKSTGRWQELLYYRPDADITPISQIKQ